MQRQKDFMSKQYTKIKTFTLLFQAMIYFVVISYRIIQIFKLEVMSFFTEHCICRYPKEI